MTQPPILTPVRSRPRLLVTTTDFPPSRGGIQRLLEELTHRLSERWRVTVITPHQDESEAYDDAAPFEVLRTRAAWGGSRAAVLGEMTRLIARRRFELLLAGHMNTLPPALIAGRGAPSVAILHGSELWAPRTRALTRLLGWRLDRAMAVSHFTASEAAKAGIPRDRIVTTPLGASPPSPEPATNDALNALGLVAAGRVVPFFLTVSRLTEPHKGHDVFLRALPSVLRHHPDAKYVIAGEGPMADELRALRRELGLEQAVLMPGGIDEITKAALMAKCRAFVMPSRESRKPPLFEGFGVVFIEAAMAGRPSLAGASGGVADAVIDGETGVLVDPHSVAEVADGALRLLDDPAYADALGERARERATRDYTWDAAITRMERYMEAVL
jgi:phosphatidylinositol alpha-1,6-mannosyltransferase